MRGDSNSLKHVRVDLADDIYKTGLFSCFWRRIRATIEERFANVDQDMVVYKDYRRPSAKYKLF